VPSTSADFPVATSWYVPAMMPSLLIALLHYGSGFWGSGNWRWNWNNQSQNWWAWAIGHPV
jgi:hypothetical protein